MSTPVQAVSDSVTVRLPFAIDPGGSLSTTTDGGLQLLDRVQALVATVPGERVMRTTYGVNSAASLFMPPDIANVQLQLAVKDATATWEPSAVITGITSSTNDSLGLVNIDVQVARSDTPGAESGTTRVVGISAGGTVSPLGV
jgi:phage baseplate assembly protein W